MVSTNILVTRSRASDDDVHDQIGSNSSTPPGAATPRPDLIDKRLPGIIHSYFGQVRDSFRTRPKPANDLRSSTAPHLPQTTVACEGESKEMDVERPKRAGGDPLPTAPSSPRKVEDDAGDVPPPLPHERLDLPPQVPASQLEPSIPYPTPPASSSSSIHLEAKAESSGSSPSGDRSLGTRALSSQEEKSLSDVLPLRVRRHTFTSPNPLSSVVAAPSLPAACISNPASCSLSENPIHAIIAQLSTSRRQSAVSLSRRGSRKLTKGGTTPPGNQSTPPQTPRTQSQDGHVPTASTPSALSRTQAPQAPTAPVAPVLGKLTVEISEGRALRPSFDPYVVCQFQWSEYISQGPINTESPTTKGARPGQPNGLGGIAMRRTESEKSKPRAIPMTSRQSSNTGKDSRDIKSGTQEVTNPKWEHKAVL